MKDILDTIKDRLSNPFLISFAIAWLICNWQITVGLIWYNSNNIEMYGYDDYKDLIEGNLSIDRNLFDPLYVAVGYTFLFPMLKLIINYFNALIGKIDEQNIMNVTKTANVPTIEYLKLEKKYKEDINELSENIARSGIIKAENARLEAANQSIGVSLKQLEVQLSDYIRDGNLEILSGYWKMDSDLKFNGKSIHATKLWHITEDEIYQKDNVDDLEYETYKIVLYVCNPISGDTVMQIRYESSVNDQPKPILYHHLQWSEDKKTLRTKANARADRHIVLSR